MKVLRSGSKVRGSIWGSGFGAWVLDALGLGV